MNRTHTLNEAQSLLLVVVSTATALGVALFFEDRVIQLLNLNRQDVEWISDVLLALVFGVAVFMWLHLRSTRSEINRLERAQVALDTELSIAAEIQRELLPPLPAGRDGWRFAAQLEQAGRIGGDFYDFVDNEHTLLVLIADVSGKGIPAALAMRSACTLFRLLARDTDRPAVLATLLGRALYEQHRGKPYITCFLARIDFESRALVWVNAGHPSAILVNGTDHRQLMPTGRPAGILSDSLYEEQVLQMRTGDTLVLVTDGVTEAIEADGRVVERLAATVTHRRSDEPQSICERVMRLARSGRGPQGTEDWQDDRTVIVVALDGP